MPAAKKPRKRRTQIEADKAAEAVRYRWESFFDNIYTLAGPGVEVSISEDGGKWYSLAVIEGVRYAGVRDTLEAAYKATSDLLHAKAWPVWVRQDAAVVQAPWAGILPK